MNAEIPVVSFDSGNGQTVSTKRVEGRRKIEKLSASIMFNLNSNLYVSPSCLLGFKICKLGLMMRRSG
jgi:hypothetical protein